VSAQFCECQPNRPADVRVCLRCGKQIVPGSENCANISAEERQFALTLIGNCQQTILKQQRIIEEVRRRYGLKV
jgi:hypothetical protein